jgi:hypothetical protein
MSLGEASHVSTVRRRSLERSAKGLFCAINCDFMVGRVNCEVILVFLSKLICDADIWKWGSGIAHLGLDEESPAIFATMDEAIALVERSHVGWKQLSPNVGLRRVSHQRDNLVKNTGYLNK